MDCVVPFSLRLMPDSFWGFALKPEIACWGQHFPKVKWAFWEFEIQPLPKITWYHTQERFMTLFIFIPRDNPNYLKALKGNLWPEPHFHHWSYWPFQLTGVASEHFLPMIHGPNDEETRETHVQSPWRSTNAPPAVRIVRWTTVESAVATGDGTCRAVHV